MWNRRVSCIAWVFTTLKIALRQAIWGRLPQLEIFTKKKLMGAILLLFRWLINIGIYNIDMRSEYNMAKTDKPRLFYPKINRNLNSAKMHVWSKFWNLDFNQSWLIARTNSQTQNGVNFDFKVKFDLEGEGQSPLKTEDILTKVFDTNGPNLVILAWTGDELSRRQIWWWTDGRTDWRTDSGNNNTRRPKLASGKNDLLLVTAGIRFTATKSAKKKLHFNNVRRWILLIRFSK